MRQDRPPLERRSSALLAHQYEACANSFVSAAPCRPDSRSGSCWCPIRSSAGFQSFRRTTSATLSATIWSSSIRGRIGSPRSSRTCGEPRRPDNLRSTPTAHHRIAMLDVQDGVFDRRGATVERTRLRFSTYPPREVRFLFCDYIQSCADWRSFANLIPSPRNGRAPRH